jgi:S1-C subfamily serine protease
MDDDNESQGTTGDATPAGGEWMPPPPATPTDPPGWVLPIPNPPIAGGSQPDAPTPQGWAPPPPAAWGSGAPSWQDPNAWAAGPQDQTEWTTGVYGNPYGGGPGVWGNPGGPAGPRNPGGWISPWSAPGQPQPRRTLPGAVTALLLVVAVLVGLGIGHGVWRTVGTPVAATGNSGAGNSNGGGFQSPPVTTPANASSIAAEVSPALVDVNTDLSYENAEAAGTGIVLTSNGLILTNNHVITGATTISVTDIGNGKTYPGTVIGYDRIHDIAVIQLQGASGLQTANIGNSSKISVGDEVIGLGNAGGTGGTPSSVAGQITGVNQSITAEDEGNGTTEQLNGLIQTDADIQPGDSGGALVNSAGRVIGVDTAASQGYFFQTQSDQGYAIPIDRAMSIAGQIRSGQATSDVHIGPTAFLGVLIQPTPGQSGASLNKVITGGPAAAAGLSAGDTITTFAGQMISSSTTLTEIISRSAPGARVEVGWIDASGQSHRTTIQLGSGPPQ